MNGCYSSACMGGRKKGERSYSLKVGMSLEKATALLSVPKSIKAQRGTEAEMDSISIEYLDHGVRVHALANKTKN